MTHVLMLVLNPMRSDSRVEKEAASLAAAGLSVTVVATAESGLQQREARDGFIIQRLPYRRVVKDRIVGGRRKAASELAARTASLDALVRRLPDSRRPSLQAMLAAHRLVLLGRRVTARGRWLVGGGLLKLVRSRMLVPEYWRSIAAVLPRRLPRPEVIHAHDLGTLAAAVKLARRWQRRHPGYPPPRVVYDSHELYVEQQTRWQPWERWLWRVHETRWIRHADLVVTVSDGIADELCRRYRLRERPVVLFNAPASSDGPSSHRQLRAELGLESAIPLVVYVGAVKPGRGVDEVVAAMPQTDWHLALVGPGISPHTADLTERARQLGIADRLHVVDAVPPRELPTYIRSADVGIHPLLPTCLNHKLAMPNKLFDYLAAGLPVAVSALPEMGQFVSANQHGVVFDPMDATDIARAVECALQKRQNMTPVDHRTTWQAQEQILYDAYRRLLPRKPVAASAVTHN